MNQKFLIAARAWSALFTAATLVHISDGFHRPEDTTIAIGLALLAILPWVGIWITRGSLRR